MTSVFMMMVLIAPLALIGGPTGATTVTQFGDGSSDTTLTFNAAGEDTSLYVTLPKMSTINTATITIEGQPLLSPNEGTADLTFNDTDEHKAWTSNPTTNISETTDGPNSFATGGVAVGDLSAVATSDDNRLDHMAKGQSICAQQFSFVPNMVEISQIVIYWEGYGNWYDGMSSAEYWGAHAFLWNNGTETWEEIGHYIDPKAVQEDKWLTNSFNGDLDDYIYNDREIRVVVSNYGTPAGLPVCGIFTDFVKAKVTGKTVEYPSDVSIDVGDDGGSADWIHAGILDTEETFYGSELITPLQSAIDDAGAGHDTVDIILSISSATPGKVFASALSIELSEYVNEAPMSTEIPSSFDLDEDTDAEALIDVKAYFADDIDPVGDLVYTVANESDPDYLHAEIDGNGLMDFTTPTENWFGTATFQVSATDTDSATTVSNEFTVTVKPVNDPPELTTIDALSFDEGGQSTIIVQATDPDKLHGGTDSFTFSATFLSGNSIFTLNPTTGAAHFIPTDAQVGTYSVEFKVTDTASLTDSETVTITIVDVNNPPEIREVKKQTLNEDELYELELEASDTDASDAGALGFTVAFPEGDALFTMGTDGIISFTPVQDQVGTHKVRFTVTDSGGLKDSFDTTFEVRNVNDPPVIDPIPSQTVNRNEAFHLTVTATDEDIGYFDSEFLEFTDNTKLFDIDPLTGEIDFTPTRDEVGNYSVTIVVTDLAGLTDSTQFTIEVVLSNEAPEAEIEVEDNRTKIKEGRSIFMTAVASDADGDDLTYKWLRKDKELGTEEDITISKLKVGKHIIVLEVSDGITTTTVEQEVKVTQDEAATPGFDAGTMLLSVITVAFALMVMARRRR